MLKAIDWHKIIQAKGRTQFVAFSHVSHIVVASNLIPGKNIIGVASKDFEQSKILEFLTLKMLVKTLPSSKEIGVL
ncbi:MAG: hypothetical protein K2L48_05590 [Mycoplasmoidaceae bacterium]|nr:hypothetical protein [Mycoplasmoidaceae bacterium]